MNETARELLDAHVAFELRQWRGKALERHLAREVGHLWDWAGETPLAAVADAATVRGAARRLVLERSLGEDLAAEVGAIARHLVAHPVNRETTVADVIDRELFDRGADLVADLEDLRERLIRRALHGRLYRMLASDLLYHGIKGFLFSDRALLQRIPGVSSLLRKGAGSVNKRLPGLEAQIERQVRAYLEGNLERTLRHSETFLLGTLTAERIHALADEVWAAAADRTLAADDVLDVDETEALTDFGLAVWERLRASDYVRTLVDAAIDDFYGRWGDRPLTEAAAIVGIGRDTLEREALALAPPVVDALRESGYLEALIRRRLEPCYASKAAARLLGQ